MRVLAWWTAGLPFGYVELIEDEGGGVHVAVIDDALGCVGDFVIVRQLPYTARGATVLRRRERQRRCTFPRC
jgi:hypothetical protein